MIHSFLTEVSSACIIFFLSPSNSHLIFDFSYYDDLSNAFDSITVTISNMEERLSTKKKGKAVNGREAVDMLMFLYDMTSSLASFLAVFPTASFLLFQTMLISR